MISPHACLCATYDLARMHAPPLRRGDEVVARMKLGEWSPMENAAALLLLLLTFRALGYLALRRRFRRR